MEFENFTKRQCFEMGLTCGSVASVLKNEFELEVDKNYVLGIYPMNALILLERNAKALILEPEVLFYSY